MNFFAALESTDRKAFSLVSANLLGPSLRTVQQFHQRERGNEKQQQPAFLESTKENITQRLDNFVKIALKGIDSPAFSIAIDATKVPELLQYSMKYCAINEQHLYTIFDKKFKCFTIKPSFSCYSNFLCKEPYKSDKTKNCIYAEIHILFLCICLNNL